MQRGGLSSAPSCGAAQLRCMRSRRLRDASPFEVGPVVRDALWRWYRGNPVEDGRLRGGTCHHCGKPTGSRRRYYCSQLCHTRTRIGVSYDPDRRCIVCAAPILHEERFNRNGCCSTQCSDTVRLVASYGLTIEQYRDIYEAQEGKCAICGRHAVKLRIDHHHGDGMVRGLLCNECNLGLGLFRDNSLILQRAFRYIDGRL
jgi:hypothetical protein